ncbi:MAG: phasin family protein [Pseudomonadota bacterium]
MTETKATKTTKNAAAKAPAETTFSERLTSGLSEAVLRSTATAKERTDDLYDSSKRLNAQIEDRLVRAAKGYVDVLGNINDFVYANLNQTYATAEKVVAAKSFSEAFQIQADCMRERSSNTMEDLRSAYDYASDVVSSNTEELRENASQLWNSAKEDGKTA